jgi:hypothetical protein
LPFLTIPFALPSATDEVVVPTVVGGPVFGVLPSKHRGFPSLGHRGAPETLGLPHASFALHLHPIPSHNIRRSNLAFVFLPHS